MKKLIILAFAISTIGVSFAQDGVSDRNYVEVRGNASKSVEPDRINVRVTLSENDGKIKTPLAQLDQAFANTLKQVEVDPKTDVVLSGQSSAVDKKRGFIFKTYIVTLKSVQKVSELFEVLQDNGINSANVANAWNTNQKEIIETLKMEAVQDAKNTAETLAKGLGQTVGKAFQIIDNNYYQPIDEGGFFRSKAMMANSDSSPLEDVGFKKTTLTQSVTVRFVLY